MDFEELKNPWSQYRMPDGRVMRCRHILTDIIQTGVDADGIPQFHLNFTAMVHLDPTEKQKSAIVEQSRAAQEQSAAANSLNNPKGTLQ